MEVETSWGRTQTYGSVLEQKEARVPGYESWWDVAVAEVSEMSSLSKVRGDYGKTFGKERWFVSERKNWFGARFARQQ